VRVKPSTVPPPWRAISASAPPSAAWATPRRRRPLPVKKPFLAASEFPAGHPDGRCPIRHERIDMAHSDPIDSDALRMQWQQALELLRHQSTITVQGFGFLFTADILLIVYGISQKIAGALVLASLMPLASIAAIWLTLDVSIPCIFVVIQLEQQLLPGQSTLGTTILRISFTRLYNQLTAVLQVEDVAQRNLMISEAKRSFLRTIPVSPVSRVAAVVFALHLCMFVFTLTLAGYRVL
jgi:hypothetical protein